MTLSDLLPKLHYPTRLEKLVDGWVHGVAAVLFTFAVGAAIGLAIWQGGLSMAMAVLIYAICVMTMIGCSMAYNLAENHKRKSLLRRFDHAAIFLMIAGTYTPFTTIRFDGAWAISMTSIVWALALIGAAGKLFLPGIAKRVWLVFYIAMGWLVVAAMGPLVEGVPLAGIILLAIGGLLYMAGVPFYIAEKLPFRRAIWHGFVMAAAAVHYAAVLTGVVFA
ncbi:MAG TPA: hemolysin III family protein [Vitreimonas sp.]|uniref:PAQR family membrane homeostasis protein TrhA n=1 Tax=Vitreimonas sp. TaxID=3069702 RepID=UPI002D673A0E|nr:hemolysin III family protein [Vitreimonas sp.]HYD86513.1 hemolysin III family protein [Vitreimonas sp.]